MAANPMNLDLPVPESTTGPAWAQQLNTQLETVVAPHDHTSGKGVQLTQDALAINGDLPLNGNDLTGVRTTRFNSLAANPAEVDDVNALCSVGGNLVYVNGNGIAVPITNGGNIDVNSVAGITGLGGTTATAGFSVDTFTFKDTVTTYANMAHGPIELYSGDDTNPANAVTLKSPNSLATAYNVTLPTALPAATSFLTIGTTGQLTNTIPTSLGINTANIANNAITPAKMATLTLQRTIIEGTVGSKELDFTSYTNWTSVGSLLSLTSTGRPIMFMLQPITSINVGQDPAGIYYANSVSPPNSPENSWGFRVLVNGNAFGEAYFRYGARAGDVLGPIPWTTIFPGIAPLAYQALVAVNPGSVTLRLQVRSITAGGSNSEILKNAEFVAYAV